MSSQTDREREEKWMKDYSRAHDKISALTEALLKMIIASDLAFNQGLANPAFDNLTIVIKQAEQAIKKKW